MYRIKLDGTTREVFDLGLNRHIILDAQTVGELVLRNPNPSQEITLRLSDQTGISDGAVIFGAGGGGITPAELRGFGDGTFSFLAGSNTNTGEDGGGVTVAAGEGASAGGAINITAGMGASAGGIGFGVFQDGSTFLAHEFNIQGGTGAWNLDGDSGSAGQVLTSNGPGAAPSWQTSGAGQAMMPFYIDDGDTYTIPSNAQGLFTIPITVDGTLVVDGILVEV